MGGSRGGRSRPPQTATSREVVLVQWGVKPPPNLPDKSNTGIYPVLLYGLEACSLSKSDLSSIDFAFNRFFMKLFKTNNIETVKSIQLYLGIFLPSVVLGNRSVKFELSFGLFAC